MYGDGSVYGGGVYGDGSVYGGGVYGDGSVYGGGMYGDGVYGGGGGVYGGGVQVMAYMVVVHGEGSHVHEAGPRLLCAKFSRL